MPFDVKALLHNKPALIGIGVAGAAGLYVLVRRKQTTGSTAAATSGAAGSGSVPTGFPDTSGTDIASWLGAQSGQLANQQQQFLDQLKGSLGTGAIPPQAGPVGIVTGGEGFNDLLKQYGITATQFLSLNPDAAQFLKTTNASGFGPGGPNSLAFDLPNGTPLTIKLPAPTTTTSS